MISVPFCNPPTDHDFPRKWFKLLGRDRKRREHDHDSRSLCLFARCKRAFISREDASVLTLPSSGKVSLFTGSASSHPTHLPSPHHCWRWAWSGTQRWLWMCVPLARCWPQQRKWQLVTAARTARPLCRGAAEEVRRRQVVTQRRPGGRGASTGRAGCYKLEPPLSQSHRWGRGGHWTVGWCYKRVVSQPARWSFSFIDGPLQLLYIDHLYFQHSEDTEV